MSSIGAIRSLFQNSKQAFSSIKSHSFSHSLLTSSHLPSLSTRRCMGILPKKPQEDETVTGTKITDVARVKDFFDEQGDIHGFNRKQFTETVEDFKNIKKIKRFGYAEFIQAALPAMKEFGVEKDLESYKALIKTFPPGAFIPTSKFTSGFFPHHVQQKAAVLLLHQMERNRVMPDKEMEQHIVACFSEFSDPWRKCSRMIYWMTKFKNANPFPLPEVIPNDPLELAIVALARMSIDPQADVHVNTSKQFTDGSAGSGGDDDTWIAYSQCDTQCDLIEEIVEKIGRNESWRVSLDGPFNAFVDSNQVSYYVLYARDMSIKKAEPGSKVEEMRRKIHETHDTSNIPLSNFGQMDLKNAFSPTRSLHEQEDGTILAMVATGSSSQQSLMDFIQILERTNPALKKISVIISNKDNTEKGIKM